ncbi:C-type lectin domain family 4 member E-like isoform X2 [Echeneis naucrates]|uniref:C-type lectin domain family 4 member E-like isoform X2 n=1 Tax=Echeneis naucrates TaxID=173247 RepID=UPI00111349FB|nr:C-type lectin domain family 4 member E-like isoform X2 [Echeneis naucrates]
MEEIYCNVYPAKPDNIKATTDQSGKNEQSELCVDVSYNLSLVCSGPRRSEERLQRAVVPGLCLLSVFLLVGLIGLGVHNHESATKLAVIKANLTEERNLLIANLTEVTEELKRLQRLAKKKKACPAGWRMLHCSCYHLSTKSASWEAARKDCTARGADLVVVDSLHVQEFLTAFIQQETWLGLTDRNSEKTWKWVNGAPLSVSYWQKGQPDKGNRNPKWGKEDCGILQPNMNAGENWNDLRCDISRQWICQKTL